jgi:amino acid transporter
MTTNSVSDRGQIGNLATIVAATCYVLAGLIFFGDAIESWGKDLQSQYPPDVPLGMFADFVTGVGITATDAGTAWAIGFVVIASVSTVVALLVNEKAKNAARLKQTINK